MPSYPVHFPDRKIATSLLILALLAVLLPASPAWADIAPPDQPPGANLAPGQERTNVRMVSEAVLIEVQPAAPAKSLGQARVKATFFMNNEGAQEERMAVRFPLTFWSGNSNGFGDFPEITDFKAWVNGRQVTTRKVLLPSQNSYEASDVPWASFDVVFPAGKVVDIGVTYTTEGMGEYPFVGFHYILETGSGWKGTIGTAELIVRLPYAASEQNVLFNENTGYSETTPGGQIQDREIRWHREDFEPTHADNLSVALVMPSAWQKVLAERKNVKTNPKDGQAWGRLGKICKEIIRYRRGSRQDPGGLALYQESVAAYQKAVELRPKDALWHAGYADALWYHYFWDVYLASSTDTSDLLHALTELQVSLALNPKTQKALDLAQEISWSIPGIVRAQKQGWDFPMLTSTAVFTPLATAAPPPTETPTPTPSFTLTPTASPAPETVRSVTPGNIAVTAPPGEAQLPPAKTASKPWLPICGAGVILPMLAALVGIRPLIQKSKDGFRRG